MKELNKLLDIIKTLRGENGCNWDKAQTIETLTGALVEEVYEVVDGIEEGDVDSIKEELGDLIFLSFFVTYIGEQENRFTMEEVLRGINQKLIRRHPHVFGGLREKNIENILKNWEEIKLSEKKNLKRKSPEEGIPKKLPEITRFFKILDKFTRNKGVLPQIHIENLSLRFKEVFTNMIEDEIAEFLKDFIIFCYQNKINLISLIRKSEKMFLKN